jgi:hypothetical protein
MIFRTQAFEVLRQLLGGMLPREREQVDDDLSGTAARTPRSREIVLEVSRPRRTAGAARSPSTAESGIVQLVRDPGDDLAEAREPLRLREALFRAPQIGDVRPR